MAEDLPLTADHSGWPAEVIAFWFETLGPEVWFIKDVSLDQKITAKCQSLYAALFDDRNNLTATTAQDTLATIIVLDQFPRNMFRDTPQAFASDEVALRLAEEAIARGLDKQLDAVACQFLYMPFQHSEEAHVQTRSVKLYETLDLDGALNFARRHKWVIERFGRFPHRNLSLGRTSTKDEVDYLDQPGSGF